MDSRSAAHVLSQIGALLRAKGEQRFKARAYAGAARALIAQNGQLAELPKFGKKTAEKILRGIEIVRRDAHLQRFPAAAIEAHMILANVAKHPDVAHAEVAGSIRRHNELVADIDIVAECSVDPVKVAATFAKSHGVREADQYEDGASVQGRLLVYVGLWDLIV